MQRDRLEVAVMLARKVCEEINSENDSNLEYIVLQGVDYEDSYARDPFLMHKITDFYNYNWLGNIDFMHIPDFNQVVYNCNNYPVIIARERDTKNIIGISTLKYDENSEDVIDPYYPILGERYFSVTGILTKMNNPYRSVGKNIYEIALRTYNQYNNIYQDTSLMCVIDCRNKNSINAMHSATESIHTKKLVKDGRLSSKIAGLYTVTNDDDMVEAPTIVIRVDQEKIENRDRDLIEFEQNENLFQSLFDTLVESFNEDKISDPVINIDEGVGVVTYYHIDNNSVLPKVISNGTERGNDRTPRIDPEIHGPYKIKKVNEVPRYEQDNRVF